MRASLIAGGSGAGNGTEGASERWFVCCGTRSPMDALTVRLTTSGSGFTRFTRRGLNSGATGFERMMRSVLQVF